MRKSFYSNLRKSFVFLFLLLYTFVPSVSAMDVSIEEGVNEDVIVDESEDILDEGISDPEWIANPEVEKEEETDVPEFTYEDGVYTVNTVEAKEYVYPGNTDVRVEFTSITEEGNLVISRVVLTEGERLELNTTDIYGWDITSSMSNGSFSYNLTLPNTQGDGARVVYTEDGSSYAELDGTVNESLIHIYGLDHFTVYVVTTDLTPLSSTSTPTCVEAGASSDSNCFNSIQNAINAASDGDTILIKNGSYTISSTINVNKEVTITGESKEGVLIDMSSLSGYGWDVSSNNVTIENMTVIGTAQTTNTARTFKFGNPEPKISNGVLNNIHVDGGYKTPFDIHGVDNFIATNLSATNTVSGVGLSLSGVNGATISGFSGLNNSWGDIAIFVSTYTSPQRGSSNITIIDNDNIGMIYAQDYPGTLVNDLSTIDIDGRTVVTEDARSSTYYFFYKIPEAPVQTGYNFNDGSDASTPREPNQLSCTGAYTNVNGISVHWTDVSDDPSIKHQRQYKVNNGGWGGNEIYSNPYTNYRSFGGGSGTEGIYGSRVRSFMDLNGNNILDAGEPASDWSNECYITFDKTPPQVPTGIYFRDVINNEDVQCGEFTNTTNLNVHWDEILGDASFSHFEYSSFDTPNGSTGLVERRFDTNFFDSSWWTIPREGTYGVQVRAVDKAGNTSDWFGGEAGIENSCQFKVDWTAPEAPSILYPFEGEYFNSTPILNDWTDVTDISGISHYRIEYIYDDGHTFSNAPYRTSSISRRNHIPNANEEGGVKFRVQAFDNAGNEGDWSEWRHYSYDSSAPSIPTNLRFENPDVQCNGITNSYTTRAAWDPSFDLVSGINRYIYYVDTPVIKGWTTTRTTNFYNGSFNQGDGEYTFMVKAIDNVGFQSEWSDTCTVIYDSTPPVSDFDTDISNSYYNTSIPLSGTTTDTYGVSHVNLYFRAAGSESKWRLIDTGTELINTDQDNTFTWSYDWTPDTEGSYDIYAAGVDVAGNEERSAYLYNISFDITPPSAPTGIGIYDHEGEFLGCNGYTNNRSIKVDWDDSEDESFSHFLYDIKDKDGHKTLTESFYNNTIRDIDGDYRFKVRTVDLAGNISDASPWCNVTLDRVAPTVQVTSHTNGQIVKGTQTISGTVEDINLSHYWFVIHNSKGQRVAGPRTVTHPGPLVEPSFSWDTTAVDDGIYTIKLEARDLADNKDSGSIHWVTVMVDNTSPIVEITSHNDGDIVAGEINILGEVTEENPGHYNISLNPDPEGLCQKELTWNFSNRIWQRTINGNNDVNHTIDTNEFEDGTYMIRLAARDIVGNRDPLSNSGEGISVEVVCITIDNTAPTAEVLSSIIKTESDPVERFVQLLDNIGLQSVCYDLGDGEICEDISDKGTDHLWNVSPIINSLGIGSHTFSYWIFDLAGNRSDASVETEEGNSDYGFDIEVTEDPVIENGTDDDEGDVAGETDTRTPTTTEPLGTGGGPLFAYTTTTDDTQAEEENEETEEVEDTPETDEEVMGAEDDEGEEDSGNGTRWGLYLLLTLPLFLLFFLLWKRRKDEEEDEYKA